MHPAHANARINDARLQVAAYFMAKKNQSTRIRAQANTNHIAPAHQISLKKKNQHWIIACKQLLDFPARGLLMHMCFCSAILLTQARTHAQPYTCKLAVVMRQQRTVSGGSGASPRGDANSASTTITKMAVDTLNITLQAKGSSRTCKCMKEDGLRFHRAKACKHVQ
eukprot:scaffold206433_cov16-Tisochrysis_lutea.AAC.1